jgi:hypothetical protein
MKNSLTKKIYDVIKQSKKQSNEQANKRKNPIKQTDRQTHQLLCFHQENMSYE